MSNYDYSIAAVIKPQFRSGIEPAKQPDEILLTDGIGLPSPDPKETRVYRYHDGSYEFEGKFPQKLLDDYVEQLLKKQARKRAGK